MPNITENYLSIKADKETFDRIVYALTKPGIQLKEDLCDIYQLKKIEVNIDSSLPLKDSMSFVFSHFTYDTGIGFKRELVRFPSTMLNLAPDQLDEFSKLLKDSYYEFDHIKYYMQSDLMFERIFNLELNDFAKWQKQHESQVDFNNIIPQPPRVIYSVINNYREKPDDPNYWYNFNCDNWDTKWNADTSAISYDDASQTGEIDFNTAWCEPTKVLVKLSEMFPEVAFENTASYEFGDETVTQFKNGKTAIGAEIDDQDE